jgi:diguanylate cyclase (GGDEF)-like protein
MDSKIGLVIQFAGIFLITVLSLFLRRSVKTAASSYWLAAWSSLSFALFTLSLAFSFGEFVKPLFTLYFFAEYFFGFMLVAGCRNIVSGRDLTPRQGLYLIPFAGLALCLSFLAINLDSVFNFHTFILAGFFSVGAFAFRNSVENGKKTFGWRVMRIALILLSVNFYHYFVLFSLRLINLEIPLPDGYLAFNPVIDLVLEILLGFGMVIVLLENVLSEVREANDKLTLAHEKLEQMAQTDPLTTAFNRHAFYGFVHNREGDVSGCVGFFDIDDLKPINDRFGHGVGDMAIRAVARSIRKLVRSEDLIFRWGGDEFFVVMVSMNSAMADRRMREIKLMLTNIYLEGCDERLTIGVSYGFKDFAHASELDEATRQADEEMYRNKQKRKQERGLIISSAPAAETSQAAL